LSNEGFPRTLVVGCAVAFAGIVEIGLAESQPLPSSSAAAWLLLSLNDIPNGTTMTLCWTDGASRYPVSSPSWRVLEAITSNLGAGAMVTGSGRMLGHRGHGDGEW
jgi:hypothetical protein